MRLRLCSVLLPKFFLLLTAVSLPLAAYAQASSSAPLSASGKAKPATVTLEAGPKWSELSSAQQTTLSPLQHLWTGLEENRKRKWLAIAKTFPSLSPQAQATAQERMKEWAALSPTQRAQARLNFAQSQQLSNDEKKAKWEAFQTLNDDEKQKLAPQKPPLPKGAATAAKPISPDKLTTTPAPKQGQIKTPRIETTEVHPRTLLPVRKASLTINSQP